MATKRRLAAILSADVVGYSRLMQGDDTATVAVLDAHRGVFRQQIEAKLGRVVDMAGDSVLAVFDSVIEAVRCAVTVQETLAERNRSLPETRRMRFRIGVNLGDVIAKDDGTVYGDGVNIAARLESLAEPGGLCVSGNVFDLAGAKLGLKCDYLGERQVKNIDAPVRAYCVRLGGEAAPVEVRSVPPAPRPEVSDKPSIAVLPFENLSGDAEQGYFADGIAEDIVTELSRLHSLLVIARNSSFAYRGQVPDVREVGAKLGARFVLTGSVRKAAGRVRITAQLVEAESGSQLWAERFDRDLADVFEVQDEITRVIVGILPSRLEAADLERIRRKPSENPAAYEWVLRGKYHHHRGTREDNATALEVLDKAIAADPDYAPAHAWKACTLGQAMFRGYRDRSEVWDQSVNEVETALSLDEDDFECHRILSSLHLIERQYERAEFHQERAIALNPNDPRIVSQRGELLTWLGRPDEAIGWLETALRVDPYRPDRRLAHLGIALFVARRYEEAVVVFKRISKFKCRHHAYLAACHAGMGQEAEAAAHAAEVLRLEPDFSAGTFVDALLYKNEADREHHRECLRKAGLDPARDGALAGEDMSSHHRSG
jgi:adenylate cyclase